MDLSHHTPSASPSRPLVPIFLVLGLILAWAPAGADELPDLEAQARAAGQALQDAERKLKVAGAAVDVAGKNTAAARRAVEEAREALRLAQQARTALAGADRALTEEEKRVEAMVEKWRAIPDDKARAGERWRLQQQIEAYRTSLRLAAGHYRQARDELLEEIRKIEAAVVKAQQAADAAFKAEQKNTAGLDEALLATLRARQEAEAARSRLFRTSLKAPPPHLEEIRVVQGDRTVYHARWEQGLSVHEIVGEVITALEKQNRDLLQRLARVGDARKRIAGKMSIPSVPGPHLLWTRNADAHEMARRLERSMVLRCKALRESGETSPASALQPQAYGERLRKDLFWQLVGAFGLYRAGFHDDKMITGFLARFQVKRMQEVGKQRPDIELDFPQDLWLPIPAGFNTPAVRQLRKELARGATEAHAFDPALDRLDARRSARETLEGGLLERMQGYRDELLSLMELGRLPERIVPRDPAKLKAVFAWSSLHVLQAALEMADDEIDEIGLQMGARRERIGALRHLLATVRTRRLLDLGREKIRTDREDPPVEVTLTFTNVLAEPPQVMLGDGFPDHAPAPPIRIKMSGARNVFVGQVAAEHLDPFAEDPGGVRLHMTGKDMVGKALDADPGTEACMLSPGTWRNWEESMHGPGRGQGGEDAWHVLNLSPWDGTSYCFVVDVSGSMGEKAKQAQTRLEAVKLAARSFIEKMDPHDEASLWIFSGTDNIRLLVIMARDKQQVVDVLQKQGPGGATALAEAIYAGGDYLLTRGKYLNKALVILTDGEETCGGNPQAAAAHFRQRVRVIGYGAGGRARPPDAAATRPDKPKQPTTRPDKPKPEIVKVQPADRKAYQVSVVGNRTPQSVVLTVTRFHEWGRDGACWVLVSEQKFYVHFGSGPGAGRKWGINSRPSQRRTLAAAAAVQGQAAMDAVRKRYQTLPGTDKQQADTEIELRVHEVMDRWEKEDGS